MAVLFSVWQEETISSVYLGPLECEIRLPRGGIRHSRQCDLQAPPQAQTE